MIKITELKHAWKNYRIPKNLPGSGTYEIPAFGSDERMYEICAGRKITVKEIVEVCGTTRQTFYRNFQDKYDLINWYFDKILLKSFEYMGKSETIYEGLVNKFYYIQQENLFFVLPLRMMIRTA